MARDPRHVLFRTLAVAALAVALSACGREPTGRPSPRPGQETQRPHDEVDTGGTSLLSADDVEPITESMARDESLESCVARERSAMTTGAREALTDLGYETFIEDVCRAERALHARDTNLCGEIPTSALRASCVVRVALAKGDADTCPRGDDGGRDALCVALASGDERLCRSVAAYHEPRCRAILRNEPRACREVRELHREECEGLVARLSPLIAPRRRTGPRLPEPAWEASAERVLADGSRQPEATPSGPDLARGIVVRTVGCKRRLVLDDAVARPMLRLGRTLPTTVEVAYVEGATWPLDVPLGLDAGIGVHLPPAAPLESPIGSRGHVRIVDFEPVRGGRVELSVDADLPFHQDRLAVRAHVVTFARDVDPLDPRCREAARAHDVPSPTTHERSRTRMR